MIALWRGGTAWRLIVELAEPGFRSRSFWLGNDTPILVIVFFPQNDFQLLSVRLVFVSVFKWWGGHDAECPPQYATSDPLEFAILSEFWLVWWAVLPLEALCPKHSDMLGKVKKQEEKGKYAARFRSQKEHL